MLTVVGSSRVDTATTQGHCNPSVARRRCAEGFRRGPYDGGHGCPRRGEIWSCFLATRESRLAFSPHNLASETSSAFTMASEGAPQIFDALPYYDNDMDQDPALRQKVERELGREPKAPTALHPNVPPEYDLFAVRVLLHTVSVVRELMLKILLFRKIPC
jgi:hypothetical protein